MNAPTSRSAEYLLAACSGLLLGLAFPPLPFHLLAYVAFVPFFFLWERMKKATDVLRYGYVFLVVFHLVTLYWQGGYALGKDVWLMVSNIAMLFGHPLFYLPSLLVAFVIRQRTNRRFGLAAFVVLWLAFEYLHSFGELSFTWLCVGNSQAYDLSRIQIAEYISVSGISAIILLFNAVIFDSLWNLAKGNWDIHSGRLKAIGFGLLVVFIGMSVFGSVRMNEFDRPSGRAVKLGMVQPNFDPWEKWGEGFSSRWISYEGQFRALMALSKNCVPESVDVIVWPETAIPFHLLHPRFVMELRIFQDFVRSMQTPVFTGLPHAEYFTPDNAPVTAEPVGSGSSFVQSFNAATLFTPDGERGRLYEKMILVPYGERIPYAETFRFLIGPLKWNVGISSWGMGTDTIVFPLRMRNGDSTHFASMICYESAYPDFVRQFVRRGAEWLVVITNDSWWGNTSGAYQHASFAVIRAIEMRRSVVQCSNGGISLAVSPSGRILRQTRMYEQTTVVADVPLRKELTWYAQHGDVAGRASVAGSLLLLLFALVQRKQA